MTYVIVAVALCLILEAFFSGTELALLSADRIKLRARADLGDRRGKLIARFLSQPQDLIATTLIGTTLCVVLSTVIVTLFMLSYNPRRAELVSIALMTPLVLVFGEIVPKSVCQARADAIAPRAIYLMWGFYALLSPVVALASRVSDVFLRLLRIHERRPFMTREELRLLLQIEPLDAPMGPDRMSDAEKRMIARIFEFSEKNVSDVMVPLSEVAALPSRTSLDEATREFLDKGYTRMPTYRQRVDEIEGVVHAFDLLRAPMEARTLSDVARPAIFVPESMPASGCLQRLQKERQGLAIVVNEYGGAAGVVTMEDILEEVVGEIEDEFDAQSAPLIRREGTGSWVVRGRAPIAVVNQELRIGIRGGEAYETVAGLVLEKLKRIPRAGEKVVAGPVIITVLSSTDRSVEEVRIELGTRSKR